MAKFIEWLKDSRSWMARVIQGSVLALVVIAVVAVTQLARGGASTTPQALRSPTAQTAQQAFGAAATTPTIARGTATATAKATTHSATAAATASSTATPTTAPATATPGLTGRLSVITATLPANAPASATCPAGTTLIGGGYNLSMPPMANYPSSATTWTVDSGSPAPGPNGTVFADCLSTNIPITASIVTDTNFIVASIAPGNGEFQQYDATCPAGVVTGGGYTISLGFAVVSAPQSDNGWRLVGYNPGTNAQAQAYAICVTGGLTTSMVSNSESVAPAPPPGGQTTFSFSVACGAKTLIGGGVGQDVATTQGQIRFSGDQPDGTPGQWDAAGGNYSGGATEEADVYAICANL